MSRTDIYQHTKKLEKAERYLQKQDINPRNKRLIQKFGNYSFMQGISKCRVIKYYRILRQLSNMLEKDFDKAKREDIEKVVTKINSHPVWGPLTSYEVKIMLKRFYKWLKGDEEYYPKCVRWLKPKFKRTDRKLPNEGELLTEDDVQMAIEAAENLRDKALISTLYESGCRVGELSSLRIKDVTFDKMGTMLSLTGKTGPRKIRIVASTPYLANWVDTHPLKKERESPLWICIGNVNKLRKMDYDTIRMMLKKVFMRAGIKKRHNPHLFRHSRATFLANHLTEFQMNHYFGWVQGSDMASTYVHLSGKEIDDAILKVNGKEELRREEKPVPQSVTCKRCNTINTAKSIYCRQCGCAIDAVTAIKMSEEEDRFKASSMEMMHQFLKENRQMFAEVMKDFIKGEQEGGAPKC